MNKNDFAPTPPMGWNSYDYYSNTVNEEQIRANARIMAEKLKNYGWEYVVIDIEWYAHNAGAMRDKYQYTPFGGVEMDEYSRLLPDPERFPSSRGGKGFAPLAEYIHSLGLKFGIHIMRGIPRIAAHLHSGLLGTDVTADEIADPSSVCLWNPDMYGVRDCADGQRYYDSLISLYASWGVDFIKCDDICNVDNRFNSQFAYARRHEVEMLANAISKQGRPIVLSLSPGAAVPEWGWHLRRYANMWRMSDDLWDKWEDVLHMFELCEKWQDAVLPGCYPDCDMLPLGTMGGGFQGEWQCRLSREEQRTMMTLWCIFGSPLMIGAELTKLDEWTLSLLTNSDVLEMCNPKYHPNELRRDNNEAVWTASDGDTTYVAVFNLSDISRRVSVPECGAGTELWSERHEQSVNPELPPHGCAVYKLDLA